MEIFAIAKGKLMMEREFYEKCKDTLHSLASRDYGFTKFEKVEVFADDVTIPFCGKGNWNFSHTLEEPQCWNHDKAFGELLLKEKPTFFLDYIDYEPICGVFEEREDTVFFGDTAFGKKGILVPCLLNSSRTKINPTDFNRIAYEMEDGWYATDLRNCSINRYELDDFWKLKKSFEEKISFPSNEGFMEQLADFVDENEKLKGGLCWYRFDTFESTFGEAFLSFVRK